MDKVIVIRYGELYLKGKNRNFFENALKNNIREKLSKFDCKIDFGRSRYIVSGFSEHIISDITSNLLKIFGIHSFSIAIEINHDLDEICNTALTFAKSNGSFKIETHRADKAFPMNSIEISRQVGGFILSKRPNLTVDLHTPERIIYIDIRENGKTFVYSEYIDGLDGMPRGTSGRGLLMLSGGIDSPVAGYLMAKRGLSLSAIHFHSYPYTSERAKQKVIDLAKILTEYTGEIKLYCVHFTKIQEMINKYCDNSYLITLIRRAMMRISEAIAKKCMAGCLINGESLGQVASQTLQSINVTNFVVENTPIFRPLIGLDKNDIIKIAEKIDTFKTSILPYEDCCTVFLPDHPATKPILEKCVREESFIPDYQSLLEEAINSVEIISIK